MIIIKSKLTQKEFVRASYIGMVSRTPLKSILLLFFYIFLAGGLYATFDSRISSMIIFVVFYLIILLILSYKNIIKRYKDGRRLDEPVEYRLTQEYLIIKGETFYTEMTWNKIDEVIKNKEWIFIWQNRRCSIPILAKDISNEEIKNLKLVLDNHHVKNNL